MKWSHNSIALPAKKRRKPSAQRSHSMSRQSYVVTEIHHQMRPNCVSQRYEDLNPNEGPNSNSNATPSSTDAPVSAKPAETKPVETKPVEAKTPSAPTPATESSVTLEWSAEQQKQLETALRKYPATAGPDRWYVLQLRSG